MKSIEIGKTYWIAKCLHLPITGVAVKLHDFGSATFQTQEGGVFALPDEVFDDEEPARLLARQLTKIFLRNAKRLLEQTQKDVAWAKKTLSDGESRINSARADVEAAEKIIEQLSKKAESNQANRRVPKKT
jgi:hypothetical protein